MLKVNKFTNEQNGCFLSTRCINNLIDKDFLVLVFKMDDTQTN